jgi:hypothetical protein
MVVIVTISRKRRFYHDHYSADMFFPLAIEVFIVFSNSLTTFVIDVLTLCGQQKAKKGCLLLAL